MHLHLHLHCIHHLLYPYKSEEIANNRFELLFINV